MRDEETERDVTADGVSPAELAAATELTHQDALSLPEAPPPTPWEKLSSSRKLAVLEALLYASDRPLAMGDLREMLGASRQDILPVLEALRKELRRAERGITLEEVAGGFTFRTRSELAPWLRPLLNTRPPRLSRAALETLAIIAYRQPVTRGEVEEVRGVDSGGVVRSLLDKRLIRILGRRNDVGRPMIYGTSREFLQTFGLKDLSALPPLAEVRELSAAPGAAEGGATPKLDAAALLAGTSPAPQALPTPGDAPETPAEAPSTADDPDVEDPETP